MHNISNFEVDRLDVRYKEETEAHQNWMAKKWKNVDWSQIPSYLVLMVQAGGGDVILYGIFFGHTLNSLIPNIQDFKPHRQSERCC